VPEPEIALAEMYRILRPGGRLVVSSLKRDADMSKLYVEGAEELRSGRARALFGPGVEAHLDDALRGYLNEASRLLDLEERGTFQFWDARELERMVWRAGFRQLSTQMCFGDPPQAVVVAAVRI
jgi:ubiquinone/menaquinone biosynthesis C-methylase UbiE